MIKYVFLVIFFMLSSSAESKDIINFDEEKLESILERLADKTNQSDLLDIIEAYIEKPIELSGSPIKKIAEIPTVSYSLAKTVKKLAKANYSVIEIIDSLNLDETTAYLLYYCSYIDKKSKKKKVKNYFAARTRIIEQMNRLKGFENNKFTGTRTDLYQRFLASYSGFSAGILLSKDLGEQYKNTFITGFVSAKFNSLNISFGDFYIKAGLGNILWYQYAMGKGADVIGPAVQFSNSIYNYKSSTEYGYFRGVSLKKSFQFAGNNELSISLWGASTPRSATVDTSLNIATSIYKTGLYRTESEIRKINSLKEKNIGGNIVFRNSNLNVGTSFFYLEYDKQVKSSSSANIEGKDALFKTIYSNLLIGDLSIASEASLDGNNNPAYKIVGEIRKRDYTLVLHGRSFASLFRSPFGYMFGEQSNPANEYGLYTGFMYKGIKGVKISSYLDYYGSYSRTYYIPVPINGIDVLNETSFKLKGKDELRIRLQFENKSDAVKLESSTKSIFRRSKYYFRAEYFHYPTDWLRLKGRVDMNLINFGSLLPDETGFSSYIELLFTLIDKVKISGRFSYFSTDSYKSAIWQYEYISPGYFTSPPLYGNGFRTFLSINWSPISNLSMWIRLNLMKRYNESTLGSGYNEILHNQDQRVYFQIDFNL